MLACRSVGVYRQTRADIAAAAAKERQREKAARDAEKNKALDAGRPYEKRSPAPSMPWSGATRSTSSRCRETRSQSPRSSRDTCRHAGVRSSVPLSTPVPRGTRSFSTRLTPPTTAPVSGLASHAGRSDSPGDGSSVRRSASTPSQGRAVPRNRHSEVRLRAVKGRASGLRHHARNGRFAIVCTDPGRRSLYKTMCER